MASVQVAIDAKDIQLIPGMGLNLGDVLKLLLNYWNPSKPLYRQIKANLAAAVAAKNPAELCKILTGGDFAEAILEAITHVLISKLQTITSALPGCTIDCSGGGPDAVSVAKTVLKISVDSFSGDGVNFGALAAGLVTNTVCCAVQMGVNYAIKKIGPVNILSKLRERCTKLLSGGASNAQRAVAAADSNAGYGMPAASDAQINAAVQTMGSSTQTTARAQAIAVDQQVKQLEAEYLQKTASTREQIRQIDEMYAPELQRLLEAARKAGNEARVNELQNALNALATLRADYQRQLQQIAQPYLTQIEQLGGQSKAILASAGLTSTVNWKPLQVAAGAALVGTGVVVFSPLVITGGAIALLVGLFRRS